MARGKLYLRPIDDVYLQHTIFPDTLTRGCYAINEAVCDNDSTLISLRSSDVASSDNEASCTSRFVMAIEKPYKLSKIHSGVIGICPNYHRYNNQGNSYNGKDTMKIFIDNTSYGEHVDNCSYRDGEDIPENYTEQRLNLSSDEIIALEHLAIINEFFPTIELEIETQASFIDNSDKGTGTGTTEHRVSQVYIELDCEYQFSSGVYDKINGTYKAAAAAYKKINGAWSEIPEDECKEILKNNHIRRG